MYRTSKSSSTSRSPLSSKAEKEAKGKTSAIRPAKKNLIKVIACLTAAIVAMQFGFTHQAGLIESTLDALKTENTQQALKEGVEKVKVQLEKELKSELESHEKLLHDKVDKVKAEMTAQLMQTAREKTIVAKATNVTTSTSTELTVVPNQCNSQSRGSFDKVYVVGEWGYKKKEAADFYGDAHWPASERRVQSASGDGSKLGHNTERSLKFIKDTIKLYNVKSMVDIPCGDVNWILDSFETDSLSLYVGLDVVSAVIEVNKQRFAHHNNKHFYFWDATECALPMIQYGEHRMMKPFDLVHVRDVIQHLTLDRGVQYFCNIFKSGAKLLMTTTYPDSVNMNIEEPVWYMNNLSAEPFSFPKNDNCIATHPGAEKDHTCLYDLSKPWVKDFIETKCK